KLTFTLESVGSISCTLEEDFTCFSLHFHPVDRLKPTLVGLSILHQTISSYGWCWFAAVVVLVGRNGDFTRTGCLLLLLPPYKLFLLVLTNVSWLLFLCCLSAAAPSADLCLLLMVLRLSVGTAGCVVDPFSWLLLDAFFLGSAGFVDLSAGSNFFQLYFQLNFRQLFSLDGCWALSTLWRIFSIF
ncbi:unnamed protein product, partial [Ilex paraguariensis]